MFYIIKHALQLLRETNLQEFLARHLTKHNNKQFIIGQDKNVNVGLACGSDERQCMDINL